MLSSRLLARTLAAAMAAAACCVPLQAQADPRYNVTVVGGTVVGGAYNLAGDQRPFSWNGGPLNDLGTLGGDTGYAAAINNAGVIVGNAATATEGTRAFRYASGTLQNLGTLPSSGEGRWSASPPPPRSPSTMPSCTKAAS